MGSEKSIEFLRNKVSYFLSASGKLQHNLMKVKESKKLIQRNFEKLNGDANPLLVPVPQIYFILIAQNDVKTELVLLY